MSRRPADDAGNSNSYSEESTESESYTINFSIRVRSLKKIVRQEIARSRDEKKSQRKSKKKRKNKKKKGKKTRSESKSKGSRDAKSSCKRRGRSTRTRSEKTRSASKTRSPTRRDCVIFEVAMMEIPLSYVLQRYG